MPSPSPARTARILSPAYVYFATLLCSACASAFFIAPTAYHRLNFRRRDKKHIVEMASRLTIMGIVALALAMTGAVVLVTDVIFRSQTVWYTGIGVGAMFLTLWFALPLLRRMTGNGDDHDEPEPRFSTESRERERTTAR